MPWTFFNSDGELRLGSSTGGVPIGNVTPFAGLMSGSMGSVAQAQTAPDGYLFCNGAVMQVVDYPLLAAKLGASYGGNGVTTFGLPSFLDYYVAGRSTPTTIGPTIVGSTTHTHTSVTNHQHSIPDHVHVFEDAHTHSVSHDHGIQDHAHAGSSYTLQASSGFGAVAKTVSGAQTAASPTHGHGVTGSPNSTPKYEGTTTVARTDVRDPGTTQPIYSVALQTTGTTASNSQFNSATTQLDTGSNAPMYFGASYIIKAAID